MADALEKRVEQLLLAGEGKTAILNRLADETDRTRLVSLLNNKTPLRRRHRYMWLNLALSAALLYVTLRRLLAISAAGHFDFYLMADFIVPTINFYVLREIMRFHRTGYLMLAVLTALGLVYPANRMLPDLLVHLGLVGGAVFLLLKLFPRRERLGASAQHADPAK
jgi:hypothetical protein